ncbi:MAG: HD-GYP domain-containing protein [Holdemania massiliensis]
MHIRVITEALLKQLCRMTDRYNLTPEQIAMISNASALHDIGKISIPESILNKPGKLTPQEYDIIKTHSAIGAEMLEKIHYFETEPLVQVARNICRWHHERYDGRGYPDGLKGEEIPISAQVVSLADVYDALVSVRVYKAAYTHEEAMRLILNGECGTFNPLLLDCLKEAGPTLKKVKVARCPARPGLNCRTWRESDQSGNASTARWRWNRSGQISVLCLDVQRNSV